MTEKTNNNEIAKDPQRLAVLARIDEYERKGWFSKDVEDDPPTIPLEPEKTDYLCKKFSNKILRIVVYAIARHFIHKIIRNKQMIIKDVVGLENFVKLRKSGLIMTCNHFNAFDNFAVYHVIEKVLPHRKMYKVIREGNYTSFPGMYGLFFRHCDTLPLSSKFSTMKLFIKSMDILLRRGEKVLVYAEQGMWWNYRKPRPLTTGAFKFAVTSNVPVLPFFITMSDSDIIGGDGFPVQEYTVHILEPIYPDPKLSEKENIEMMRGKNYQMWKDVYEKTYGIPLEYLK
ncbi:MAG: 1-acyl-sn-glycerol-3-phosphate acyltransferase [Treponema sp.]|uniref:lysophospholipid acyltransferase family protein n=1 Tax=Treponema sp. TaxID=166 RepID=UPI00298DE217|nr:lysophospholipid acyltransferase family protein [Treponema sp.]MCR5387508.1 1-acyl-sn-glycerol-3-phosphate acyltransferase [Treponema sp.]